MPPLTEKEIQEQLRLNQGINDNPYNLPLDSRLELLDIRDQIHKQLKTGELALCADCTNESLLDREDPPLYVSGMSNYTREKTKCEGFECKNSAQFWAHYTDV